MERQFSVDYNSPAYSQENREDFPSINSHVPPPYWQFATDFRQTMGEDAEPDALFFVESWMLGASAAIENLKQRRAEQISQPHMHESHRAVHEPHRADHEPATTEPFEAARFGSASFTAESFIRERQTQFCTSHYAVPPAPSAEPSANRSHRKLRDNSETFSDDFEGMEPLNQTMTKPRAQQILGVTASSTRSQIKSAFRRMVNEWHPDRFEWSTERARQVATEKMSLINKAYHLLRTTV